MFCKIIKNWLFGPQYNTIKFMKEWEEFMKFQGAWSL